MDLEIPEASVRALASSLSVPFPLRELDIPIRRVVIRPETGPGTAVMATEATLVECAFLEYVSNGRRIVPMSMELRLAVHQFFGTRFLAIACTDIGAHPLPVKLLGTGHVEIERW